MRDVDKEQAESLIGDPSADWEERGPTQKSLSTVTLLNLYIQSSMFVVMSCLSVKFIDST